MLIPLSLKIQYNPERYRNISRSINQSHLTSVTHSVSSTISLLHLNSTAKFRTIICARTYCARNRLQDGWTKADLVDLGDHRIEKHGVEQPMVSTRLQSLQRNIRKRRAQSSWRQARELSIRQRPRPILPVHSEKQWLVRPQKISLASWDDETGIPASSSPPLENRRNIDEVDLAWIRGIMRLQAREPLKIFRPSQIQRFVERYACLQGDRKWLHLLWAHLPLHYRLQRWQDAMLWCIQNSPRRALMILLITVRGRATRPPKYMLLDSLQFLARHFLLKEKEKDPWAVEVLWQLTVKAMSGSSTNIRQSTLNTQEPVRLLLRECNNERAKILYDVLHPIHLKMSINTMLQFLARFADIGNVEICMNLLKHITSHPTAVYLANQQLEKACVKLLRTSWGQNNPYPIQSAILSQMLEWGIKPNTPMCNAILLNMIEGRDYETAWKTFEIAQQSDHLKIHSVTYAILAKGAKLSGNLGVLETILHEVKMKPELLDDVLMTELLTATRDLNPGNGLSAMLGLYQQYYDAKPLFELGLSGLVRVSQDDTKNSGKLPSQNILGLITSIYNRSNTSTDDLIRRYRIFRGSVEQDHPVLAPLARTTYVPNSFLLAFGQKIETLPYCTMVLKHMFSSPASAGAAPFAKPDVMTWTILMQSYLRHKQKHAAEKVLAMMSERGIKPDSVSWNALINGYCGMQDVEGAVGSLKRMETAGHELNSWTFKGLGKVKNRQKLLKLLRTQIEQPSREQEPSHEVTEN